MADRAERQSRGTYHHGDLGRTLVAAAAEIIAAEGVAALTLRGVGERAGVSRTALYRHYEDKAALLAAVALEGFRLLRSDLEAASGAARAANDDPMAALGGAYVAFGVGHPAHYRVMFGPSLMDKTRYPALVEEAQATFAVLVETIGAGQGAGRLKLGDPLRLAQVVWSTVHGIVLLTTDGRFDHLPPGPAGSLPLPALAAQVLATGMMAPARDGGA